MTKSSEVLRLAAEYTFNGVAWPVTSAAGNLKTRQQIGNFLRFVGYPETETTEHSILSLCLAAAIAESEGD